MRVLSISFRNLNSLRGPETIRLDSGPLAAAGLYAITGPTGSGKSTILDAITLALYARAARYTGRAEEMMSRGTAECFAAVEFACASGTYEARWMLKRSRGKASGALQPARRELSRDGVIIATQSQASATVEELTGLDYERFLRSVLLAQGQFAAFLRSSRDHRSDLLERITGTQLYSELGSLAHIVHSEHQEKLREATARLQGLTVPDDAAVAALEAEQAPLRAAALAVEKERAALQALLHDSRRAESLALRRQRYDADLANHESKAQRFIPDAVRLTRHREASVFAPDLAKLSESRRNLDALQIEEKAHAALIENTRKMAAAAAASAMQTASAGQDEAYRVTAAAEEAIRHESEELEVITKWLAENAAEADLAQALPELQEACAAWQTARQRTKDAVRAHQVAADRLAAQQAAVRASFEHWNQAKADAGEAKETAHTALTQSDALLPEGCADFPALEDLRRTAIDRLNAWRAGALAHDAGRALIDDLAKCASELNATRTRIAMEKASVLTARERAESARRETALLRELAAAEALTLSLVEHRAHLQEGQPCALCGSREHPYATPGMVPSGAAARLAAQEQREKAAHAEVQKTDAAQRKTLSTLAEIQAAHAALTERLHQICQRILNAWNTASVEWPDGFSPAPENMIPGPDGEWRECQEAHFQKQATTLTTLTKTAAVARQDAAAKAEFAGKRHHLAEMAAQKYSAAQESASLAANQMQEAAALRDRAAARESATLIVWKERLPAHACSELDPAEAMPLFAAREKLWRSQEQRLEGIRQSLTKHQALRVRSVEESQRWLARHQKINAEAEAHHLPTAPAQAAAMEWNEAGQALQDRLRQLTAAHSLHTDIKQRLASLSESTQTLTATLTATLQPTVFSGIEELRTAILTPQASQELKEIEKGLTVAAAALQQTLHSLTEETANLQQAYPAGLPCPANASAQLEEADQRWRVLQQRTGALAEQQKAYAAAREQAGTWAALLEQQRAEAAPWDRLNALIGSLNGQKFSRMAQAVTLQQLVHLANDRLHSFTDRYEIRRAGEPADLALEIMDRWQAHTVRPMESLSGGETFLVSLALALGLSELAGRRARIGSLFIDEGFGTLDSEALDTALTALESLRHDHSTIGVISHVDSLKARLTARIEVVRSGGGWSRLHIPGQ